MKQVETIFVTYCARTKSDHEHGTPEQIYISNRVKAFFKYAPKPRAILSYKYGILWEAEIIDNYEQTKPTDFTLENLEERIKNKKLVVWLPRPCEAKPWIQMLDSVQADYEVITRIKELSK